MIYKNKHKVETQKYTININFSRKITSTKMKNQPSLLVSVILLFINEHLRKTNKGKKVEKTKKGK